MILEKNVHLAVNGTLMRGLELNKNLVNAGAEFVREDKTDDYYRLWSINEKHPAMIRTLRQYSSITVEIWSIPKSNLADILINEPAGLCIGKVHLLDGSQVLGVIGEPWLVEEQQEITLFGGWRNYLMNKTL